jgi:peroxiredoxin
LKVLGVSHLYGMSTQDSDYQREAVERLHLPFAILSDAGLRFTHALRLPTFAVDGMTLQKPIYSVFPPDESAGAVAAWLRASR